MRGAVRAGGLMTAAVAAAALALPAAAAARMRVRVSPREGSPSTVFTIRFRNPVHTGTFGALTREEQLKVSALASQAGCVSTRTVTLRPAWRGRRLRVRVGPGRGAAWCAGGYQGTLSSTASIHCGPPAMLACPLVLPRPVTLARFSFEVTGAVPGGSGSQSGPTFAGLTSATTCGPVIDPPGAVEPNQEYVRLAWSPASDPATPSSQIVYEIFYSSVQGGEDFSSPTWTTAPGATSFGVSLPGSGPAYFVVRARDSAGLVDGNTVEREAVPDCATGG